MFAQPHARAAAVFVDKFDAGSFKSAPNYIERRMARLTRTRFKLMDGNNPDLRLTCKLLLAPSNQTSSCSALRWRDHQRNVANMRDSYNSIEFLLTSTLHILYIFL